MSDTVRIRIAVEHLPTSEVWESKIDTITTEAFEQLKNSLMPSIITGETPYLSLEDEEGTWFFFGSDTLKDCVISIDQQ